MRFEWVLRYSKPERLFRVFRVTKAGRWPEIPAHKWTLAVRVRPCINPFRFHHVVSYGGNFG